MLKNRTSLISSNSARFRRLSRIRTETEEEGRSEVRQIVLMLLLHIVLAFVMQESELAATIHSVLVLGVGVWNALTGKSLTKLLPIVAYIVGSEVLWRMTDARIFWEFSKYSVVIILVVGLLKHRNIRGAIFPVFFFVLLIPSIILTINQLGFTRAAREAISFNLSGALTLTICAITFLNVKLAKNDVQQVIWAMVYPITSVFILALSSTIGSREIVFTPDSNYVTSGGYGPNQVSAILGLGSLLLGMMLLITKKGTPRLLVVLLAVSFIGQAILTFSRGGIVNVAISALAVIVQLILKPEKSFKRILFFLVIVLIIVFVVAPRLDDFTSGALRERYSDFDTTGRAEMLEADLELFGKNKLTGVGVGMSARFRRFMQGTAAHTEYSRLLAEHGFFGVAAILLLIFMFVRAWFKAPDTISKAWTLSLSAWVFVEMSHAAMRVACIGFVFGWALCGFQSDEAEHVEHVDAPEYFDESERWNQEALNQTYRGRRLIRSKRRSPRTS